MNLRYTNTKKLRTIVLILDIIRTDDDYLEFYSVFNAMTDDEFDMFVSGIVDTCADLNADINNNTMINYIIRSEIIRYAYEHGIEHE